MITEFWCLTLVLLVTNVLCMQQQSMQDCSVERVMLQMKKTLQLEAHTVNLPHLHAELD